MDINWFVRKVIYAVIAIAGVVLAGFGIVSTDSADQLSDQVMDIVPSILAIVAGGYAATKTHPGSDSTVTAEDVTHAAIVARGDSGAPGKHRGVSTTTDYAAMVRGDSSGEVS